MQHTQYCMRICAPLPFFNTLQHDATRCNTLQQTTTHRTTVKYCLRIHPCPYPTRCNMLQHKNALHHTANLPKNLSTLSLIQLYPCHQRPRGAVDSRLQAAHFQDFLTFKLTQSWQIFAKVSPKIFHVVSLVAS